MSKSYPMPSLGAGMEAGTVVEWHVQPGQKVSRGDVVGVVDTEKGAIEIEIWEDAEVAEIVAAPGTRVPVGEPLLLLKETETEAETPAREAETDADAETPEAATTPEAPVAREPQPSTEPTDDDVVEEVWNEPSPDPPPAAEPPRRLRVSPVARKRAKELNLDLDSLHGSGPGGAITLADVETAAQGMDRKGGPPPPSRAPEPEAAKEDESGPDAGVDRHAAMRKAIATAMTRSKREIPHYYLAHTFSLESTLLWLEQTNRDRSPSGRLLLAALYLKAVARAVQKFPEFNGFWEDDAFRRAEGVNPGMAISLRDGGLVAPAIHDADTRSLEELTEAVRDVVHRSRAGLLRGSEVADPTITVTSLGDRGVDTVFGVIYPPQVAIVGIGSVAERPWAEGGMLGSRRVVTITLAADHRASDGHRGALFLEHVSQLLQSPEDL